MLNYDSDTAIVIRVLIGNAMPMLNTPSQSTIDADRCRFLSVILDPNARERFYPQSYNTGYTDSFIV